MLAEAEAQAWHWADAEARYRDALGDGPQQCQHVLGLGALLVHLGRTEEGLGLARRGRAWTPLFARQHGAGRLAPLSRAPISMTLFGSSGSHLAPTPTTYTRCGAWGLLSSRYQSTTRPSGPERVAAMWDRNPAALGILARAYGRAGKHAEASHILDKSGHGAGATTYRLPCSSTHTSAWAISIAALPRSSAPTRNTRTSSDT